MPKFPHYLQPDAMDCDPFFTNELFTFGNIKIKKMNAAEIKLELFRRIDKLPKADLESLYDKFIALLDTNSKYKLNDYEKKAVEEALEKSEKDKLLAHVDVLNEASEEYPKLKFNEKR